MHYKAEIECFLPYLGYDIIGILKVAKAPTFQKSPTFDQFCTSLYMHFDLIHHDNFDCSSESSGANKGLR
jgi:hypothetical protein